jgi:hypothetical protein
VTSVLIERTARRLNRLVSRDLAQQSDSILVVVPEELLTAMRQKLARDFTRAAWRKVAFVSLAAVDRATQRRRKACDNASHTT